MKKILNFALVLGLFFLAACTDLDLQPKSSTTASALFKDESAYRAFLAKVYASIAVTGQQGPAGNTDISSLDEGFSNYLRQLWQLEELPTDEAVIGWGDEGIQDLHKSPGDLLSARIKTSGATNPKKNLRALLCHFT